MNATSGAMDGPRTMTRITQFTDPLCSWSWAFEPVRRQLADCMGADLEWHVRMGGLIPDWDSFRDPLQAIHTPAQFAPAWYHVGSTTGITIDPGVWHDDPPASSFPACIAVKAAARQGHVAETVYLRAAREAVMTERLNIARTGALLTLADHVATACAFHPGQFATDLVSDEAREAFTADLRDCRARGIGRFPTFIIEGPRCSRVIVGYRPLRVMLQVLEAVGAALPFRAAGSGRSDLLEIAGK